MTSRGAGWCRPGMPSGPFCWNRATSRRQRKCSGESSKKSPPPPLLGRSLGGLSQVYVFVLMKREPHVVVTIPQKNICKHAKKRVVSGKGSKIYTLAGESMNTESPCGGMWNNLHMDVLL